MLTWLMRGAMARTIPAHPVGSRRAEAREAGPGSAGRAISSASCAAGQCAGIEPEVAGPMRVPVQRVVGTGPDVERHPPAVASERRGQLAVRGPEGILVPHVDPDRRSAVRLRAVRGADDLVAREVLCAPGAVSPPRTQ